jgi:hypothetical protein
LRFPNANLVEFFISSNLLREANSSRFTMN